MTTAAAQPTAPPRLVAWLRHTLGGTLVDGPVPMRRLTGGQSNPSYLLDLGGTRLVLRKRGGARGSTGAHQIDREYRLLRALHGGAVAVPRPLGYCRDEAVLGAEFAVVEYVDRAVLPDPRLPGLAPAARSAVARGLADALAEIHAVDVQGAGLADFGPPRPYLARQLRRWTAQHHQGSAPRTPELDALADELARRLPLPEDRRLVHGDFRIDNVIVDAGRLRPAAVLDWELATIGDPLADLAHHVLPWLLPRALYRFGMAGDRTDGTPTLEQHLEAYRTAAGRSELPHLDARLAFALFRLAAIHHGIRSRLADGTAADPRAAAHTHPAEIAALGLARLAGG